MRWLLLLLGLLLIGVTLLDALWTTIAPRGAGPVTKRLARGLWSLGLSVHRRRSAHGLLTLIGPSLLVVATLAWVAGLWAGWLLVFSAEPGTVVTSLSKEPASLVERVYYVGFVLFTLGTGDYVPEGGVWQVLSVLASLSGLSVITLAITYLLSVISAVAAKRQLAGSIHSLGGTPTDVVRQAWDGGGFSGLEQQLSAIASALEIHTQRHFAYPVLHYFHSADRRTALGPAVAVLDDALLLLAEGVAPDVRPTPAVVAPTRSTVASFLSTLNESFIEEANESPPSPPLRLLKEAGVPVVGEGAFAEAVDQAAQRRRLLRGFVRDSGWTWDGETALRRPASA